MRVILLIILLLTFSKSFAQSRLSFFVNNVCELDSIAVEFENDKLSDKSKLRLNDFVLKYQDRSRFGDSVKIILNPALSPNEYKVVNNQIGKIRLVSVMDYLERNLNIKIIGQKSCGEKDLLSCEFKGRIE